MASQGDAPEISNLLAEVVSASPYYSEESKKGEKLKYTAEFLEAKLRDPNYIYLVAKNEAGKITGYCLGHREVDCFLGDWLGVSEENRQIGIASVLISHLFDKLRKGGIKNMKAHTRLKNLESINLLRKLGFQNTGLIKQNWYHEDSLVWEIVL